MTQKLRERLAKLPPNSGHAKVLRGKLGIPHDGVVEEAPIVKEEPLIVKKPVTKKRKSK